MKIDAFLRETRQIVEDQYKGYTMKVSGYIRHWNTIASRNGDSLALMVVYAAKNNEGIRRLMAKGSIPH